jgi:hypothetical protein
MESRQTARQTASFKGRQLGDSVLGMVYTLVMSRSLDFVSSSILLT